MVQCIICWYIVAFEKNQKNIHVSYGAYGYMSIANDYSMRFYFTLNHVYQHSHNKNKCRIAIFLY